MSKMQVSTGRFTIGNSIVFPVLQKNDTKSNFFFKNYHKNQRNAFSVAEALIALLIASLILGMSAPMISKQIKHNNFSSVQTSMLNKKIKTVQDVSDLNTNTITQIMDGRDVSSYVAYIKNLEAEINALKNNPNIQKIISGTNQSKNYDSDISSLKTQLNSKANSSDLTKLKTNVNNIDKDLTALENDVTDLEDDIKNLVPKGTVAFFNLSSCPSGWSAISANWRGRFPRFAGSYTILGYNGSTRKYATTGTAQTLSVGATQEDTIRNIIGELTVSTREHSNNVWLTSAKQAFSAKDNYYWGIGGGGGGGREYTAIFNASANAPTSAENRPKAVALLGCVKK